MKHPHPHTPRIEFLHKQIEQDEMMLDEYRRDQADDQARYLRPDTKYTETIDIAKAMRSRTGKIAQLEKHIETLKKELKALEDSAQSDTFAS